MNSSFTKLQLFCLFILRVGVGWYFLYEGVAKLMSSGWTSYGYLIDSQGLFSSLYYSLAKNQFLLPIVDKINIFGLILIGLSLILGLFEKVGYISAIFLLIVYYSSHPAMIDAMYQMPSEGAYFWINKNILIMLSVIVLMVFPTGKYLGLDALLFKRNYRKYDERS